jgi:N6-L-threonylcarbamoyladenine synthase
MKILAIESSCDETAAAIVEDGVLILSNVVASSHLMHEKYGGIVPEVAARQQLEYILPTIKEALIQASLTLADIDAVAVAAGPGLVGSLLVGVETAKAIALTLNKPMIPVNHVLAHMYANYVRTEHALPVTFPAISLVVSGGHTELYLVTSQKELTWLGGTIDDAAGEAFDKTARLLGFGNGGGVAIQKAATQHTPSDATLVGRLPRPLLDQHNYLNFSFSGLKTAILREAQILQKNNTWDPHHIHALAYEVQETITDVLVKKTLRALEKYTAKAIMLSGGVAANIRLREKFIEHIKKQHLNISFHVPPIALCTDNAVYIASYAFFRGTATAWSDITAIPDLDVEVTM